MDRCGSSLAGTAGAMNSDATPHRRGGKNTRVKLTRLDLCLLRLVDNELLELLLVVIGELRDVNVSSVGS